MSDTGKWTPGPWVVNGRWIEGRSGTTEIAEVITAYGNDLEEGYVVTHEGVANARLIAAAPELLEGCKKALELLEPFDDPDLSLGLGRNALTGIRAAIAKATGES